MFRLVATTQSKRRPTPTGFMTRQLWFHVLMVTCVAMLIAGRNETTIIQGVRQQATDLSAPVLETMAGPLERVRRLGAQFGSYQFLFGELTRMKQQNESLQLWKSKAIELERQVRRYEELLNARHEPASKFVTARVIADARGPFVHTVIVNAGRSHGVREHQAVMDGRGLVGRTLTAGKDASRVLLVSDLNSRIPVRVEPHGYRAILTGTNEREPRLDFLPAHVSLREGDTVFTSGDGGQLPPGLPIGTVGPGVGGTYTVVPFANPSRLSYVRIFDYAPSLAVETQASAPAEEPTTKVAGAPTDSQPKVVVETTPGDTQPEAAAEAQDH